MIISASRRTDIPTFYSEWFLNRVKEGFVYVRNPVNQYQVSKIMLSPDIVDCIVFWTKNPIPMLNRLDEIKEYKYYFQYTLTGYGKDMEAGLPDKKNVLIPAFQELSKKIGKKCVIWRYDPIVFTQRYTPEYHINAFRQIAEALNGYTDKCVISFVDIYEKNKENMQKENAYEMSTQDLEEFATKISGIARENGITVASCAEKINLNKCGIEHNCCIDKKLIEEIIGCNLNVSKDKTQRLECGCMESIDIGAYNTCSNGCKYCYANYDKDSVSSNCRKYDVNSPLLCSKITEFDTITERKVKSMKEYQLSLDLM